MDLNWFKLKIIFLSPCFFCAVTQMRRWKLKWEKEQQKLAQNNNKKNLILMNSFPPPANQKPRENETLKSKQKQKLTQFFSCSLEARNSVSNKRKVEGKFVKNRSIWTRREEGERFSINHKSSTLFPWVLMTILAEDSRILRGIVRLPLLLKAAKNILETHRRTHRRTSLLHRDHHDDDEAWERIFFVLTSLSHAWLLNKKPGSLRTEQNSKLT